MEIIVVDDGSVDGSADIASRYPDVQVVRRPHLGLGATRNAGIDVAGGCFVAFCDADDTWMPRKTRVQVDYLDDHPAVDIALCRQETLLEPGVDQPGWLIPDQRYGDLDGVSPTSGLFRRRVFEKVRFAEDAACGNRLQPHGEGACGRFHHCGDRRVASRPEDPR